MDLFDYMRENNKNTESPLAMRLRPETLDEVIGQQHIIGKDKLLYRAIKADKLSSVIFYGPPGTGKTTLARVIAKNIVARRKEKPIETTLELAKIVEDSYPAKTRWKFGHPAKRTFQAIRIAVNGELNALDEAITQMARRLKKGG